VLQAVKVPTVVDVEKEVEAGGVLKQVTVMCSVE